PHLTSPPFPKGPRREDQDVRPTGMPGRLARRGTWSTRLRPTLTPRADALRRGKRYLSSLRDGFRSWCGDIVVSFGIVSVRPSRRLSLGVDSYPTPTRHSTLAGITLLRNPRPPAPPSFSTLSLFPTQPRAPVDQSSPLRRAPHLRSASWVFLLINLRALPEFKLRGRVLKTRPTTRGRGFDNTWSRI
ncbi:hypothetical protein DFH09DRAFT_1138351, partial [Mycena vulgaris]